MSPRYSSPSKHSQRRQKRRNPSRKMRRRQLREEEEMRSKFGIHQDYNVVSQAYTIGDQGNPFAILDSAYSASKTSTFDSNDYEFTFRAYPQMDLFGDAPPTPYYSDNQTPSKLDQSEDHRSSIIETFQTPICEPCAPSLPPLEFSPLDFESMSLAGSACGSKLLTPSPLLYHKDLPAQESDAEKAFPCDHGLEPPLAEHEISKEQLSPMPMEMLPLISSGMSCLYPPNTATDLPPETEAKHFPTLRSRQFDQYNEQSTRNDKNNKNIFPAPTHFAESSSLYTLPPFWISPQALSIVQRSKLLACARPLTSIFATRETDPKASTPLVILEAGAAESPCIARNWQLQHGGHARAEQESVGASNADITHAIDCDFEDAVTVDLEEPDKKGKENFEDEVDEWQLVSNDEG